MSPQEMLDRAIEQTVRLIEQELHQHLDAVQRIAVERALEQLVDDVALRRERW
jgi:hypothetical protein